MIILLLTFALFAAVLLAKSTIKPNNYPPGPKRWPLVGTAWQLKKYDALFPFKALVKLGDTYGPVIGLYLGPSPLIAVNGYEAVKEALTNEHLNGRPDTAARRERTFNKRLGIMFTDGEFFLEQRRFTLRNLRDLGLGRTSTETAIHDEMHELMDDIASKSDSDPGRVVDFTNAFNLSLINVMWALVGGERFSRTDVRLQRLLDMVDAYSRHFRPITATLPIPGWLLARLPASVRRSIGLANDMLCPLQDFIRMTIDEHEKCRQEDCPRDYIDVYLNEMHRASKKGSSFHVEQLVSIIIDLFLAGGDTTKNSIGFALLYLMHNVGAQRKMQAELDRVCGPAVPSLVHRPELVYTEAVLMETLRLSSVVPFTLMHCAMSDTTLQGYTVPKGAAVLVNLYSINSDESYWHEPAVFRPERHLSRDESTIVKSRHLIPFGVGKRACLGEPLARNEFYLFTAGIVKAFNIERVPGEPAPSLDPLVGVVNGYQGFRAVVTKRT